MSHHNNNNQPQRQQYQQDDFVDVDDYNSASGYPLQNMTPQQQRQEERRRHAENATTNGAAAAAAGQGASPWLNKQKKKSGKWKTIAWSVLVILILAVAGVLAWYFAVYKKNNSNGGSNNSNGSTGGGGNIATGDTVISPNGTVLPNTNYPLKKVFYGMAYVPLGAQLPGCFNTQASVDEELDLLAQTTSRVRLYGTDCKVLEHVLDSIERKKLDLKVMVGIWIDKDNATHTRQIADFFKVMEKYSWSNIIGVSVGNEVIFDDYQPLPVLISLIAEVKAKVVALGHNDIPVFTSDLESASKPTLTDFEDRAGVNLHPFFSGIPINEAAAWYWKHLKDNVTPVINSGTKKTDIWITEVGWPTFPASAATKASVPSIPNLQIFLDTWLCEANKNGMPYYYFEFFDAPWKIWPGSAVEGFWGLLTIDKKLKVKLPECLI